jgi:hypothetical protein
MEDETKRIKIPQIPIPGAGKKYTAYRSLDLKIVLRHMPLFFKIVFLCQNPKPFLLSSPF